MIYVRLAGGLGNQLFQLCAAMLLSQRTGLMVVPFTGALDRYQVKRAPDSLRLLDSTMLMHDVNHPTVQWLTLRARIGRWPIPQAVNDATFWPLLQGIAHFPKHMFVDGYFQSRWNDALIREAMSGLRETAEIAPASTAGEHCVIHIRGGDFLTAPAYQVIDHRFYARAIAQAKAEGFHRFAILTDDASYASKIEANILIEHPDIETYLMHPGTDALEDFRLLMGASARIIGNSTFGWWATAMDANKALTWSPNQFLKGTPRDFVLSYERVLAI